MGRTIHLAAAFMLLVVSGCQSAEYREARRLYEAGMYEEALGLLEKDRTNRPENSKTYLLVGHACLRLFAASGSEGMWNRARKSFARGFRLDNAESHREEIARAYISLGKEHLQVNGPHSVRCFQQAVRVDLQKKFEIARFLLEHQERLVREDEERYVEECDPGLLVLATIYDVTLKERAVALYLERLKRWITGDVVWKHAGDRASLEVETRYERAMDCYRARCSELDVSCGQEFFGLLLERAKRAHAEGDARTALFFTTVASSHTAQMEDQVVAGLLADIGRLAAERDEARLSREAIRRARELDPSHNEPVEATSH